ncbi:glycerol-3-phosphate dehydrogenase [Elioraea rosea]|uniref:glycerol-3-phosphate dehydrogenase n=1 Tax=Elioraea rosea TaxID=2492390 RepID=UPI001EF6299E|nr:glycerol-3-phosphate dehydrogenase [Elioraea rosea]
MASEGIVDLAIIGGSINGAGIARDAAGRGLSVHLVEQGDLGGATSSASTKLIHGGLRYLEHYAFRLVREALEEREVLWRIAPHIIWPLRFVLPHHQGLRPAWMLRLGFFLYDRFGGRPLLPGTEVLDLRGDPAGGPLQPGFAKGFEYSDCWVEDSRLAVLNARDAVARGAVIETRTRCLSATREDGAWTLTLAAEDGNGCRTIRARTVVNAAGPWVAEVPAGVVHANAPAAVRLVQGSHVVVPRLFAHDHCYIFQNTDSRNVFAIPYEGDLTLIGTTDRDWTGAPSSVAASGDEIAYLCRAGSAYLKRPVTPADVVWTCSGVRRSMTTALPPHRRRRATTCSPSTPLRASPPCSACSAARSLPTGASPSTRSRTCSPTCLRASATQQAGRGRAPLPGGGFAADGFDALVTSLGESMAETIAA